MSPWTGIRYKPVKATHIEYISCGDYGWNVGSISHEAPKRLESMESDLQVIAILVWSKLRAILAADPVSPHCIFALELAFPGDLLQSCSAHHIVVFEFADEEKKQKDMGSVCLHVDM